MICGETIDEGGGEEKERKTKAEVDGQCECGLEGDGIVGRGSEYITGLCGGNLLYIYPT